MNRSGKNILSLAGLLGAGAQLFKENERRKAISYPLYFAMWSVPEPELRLFKGAAQGIPLYTGDSLHFSKGEINARVGDKAWNFTIPYFKSGDKIFDVVTGEADIESCARACLIAAVEQREVVHIAQFVAASSTFVIYARTISAELRQAALDMLSRIEDEKAVMKRVHELRALNRTRITPLFCMSAPSTSPQWSDTALVGKALSELLIAADDLLRVTPTEMVVVMVSDTARESTSEVGLMLTAKGRGGDSIRQAFKLVSDRVLATAGDSRDHLTGDHSAVAEVTWPDSCSLPPFLCEAPSPPHVKVHPLAHMAVDGEHHELLLRGRRQSENADVEDVPQMLSEAIRMVRKEVSNILHDIAPVRQWTVDVVAQAAESVGGAEWSALVQAAAEDVEMTADVPAHEPTLSRKRKKGEKRASKKKQKTSCDIDGELGEIEKGIREEEGDEEDKDKDKDKDRGNAGNDKDKGNAGGNHKGHGRR